MLLSVARSVHGQDVVVRVSGELDIASVAVLEAGVTQALAVGPQRVFLDLTGLAFIDSTGCRELARAARTGQAVGASVELVVPPANTPVRRVVEFMQLDARLPLHERLPAP